MTGLFDLRPHQVSALDGLRGSLRSGKRRPMLQLPTGAGKTVIAAHIVHGAKAKGKRVTFCVPALSLIDQTFERFVANGIDPGDMGMIQGDHPWRRPAAPIQIASVQTLRRRGMPDTGLLVVDEAHIRDAWLHAYLTDPENASLPAVGLSATPWSAGLGKIYDDLVKPVTMRELIDGGYLSKFRVFAPSHPDLDGVKTVAGDFHEGDLAERMSKPQLVADVVSTWMAKGHGLPTLCFCVNRAHARLVHDQFTAEGIRAAYVDANTPREEREEIGKRLAAGDVEVVCNIGTLTTGIDWDVRCLILARPTKSDALFVQIIGRALRTADGKDHALILDHSDTHLRLGMVDEIDHDALSNGNAKKNGDREDKEDRLPLPWECDECGALAPACVKECPNCGHVRKPRVGVDSVDGELSELTRDRKARRKGESAADHLARMGKQQVYSQLLTIRAEKGAAPGWVAHKFREIFGSYPRGWLESPAEPSFELRSFIRSRDIAWAKSKKREVAA